MTKAVIQHILHALKQTNTWNSKVTEDTDIIAKLIFLNPGQDPQGQVSAYLKYRHSDSGWWDIISRSFQLENKIYNFKR
jgi:hypothetical protein